MPRHHYHIRVLRIARHRKAAPLLAAGLVALTLLAACGEPPAPPLTAPPEAPGNGSAVASGPPPSGVVPGMPTAPPTLGVTTYPTVAPYPTNPIYPTTTAPTTPVTTSPTTPAASPAPRCGSGPTKEQVLAVVKGRPGVPAADLKVIDGPFCSKTWQFTIVQIATADANSPAEPLLVVTNGKPATLKVIEAGTDVCSVKVRSEAPAGIRVWACGAA
jgi:hypothetical protein